MKTEKDIEEHCKKLKPVIGDEADQLWYIYLTEDEKGRRDLTLDIEILAEKLLKQDALTPQEILLNPPSMNEASGSFLLGDIVYNQKKLHPLFYGLKISSNRSAFLRSQAKGKPTSRIFSHSSYWSARSRFWSSTGKGAGGTC